MRAPYPIADEKIPRFVDASIDTIARDLSIAVPERAAVIERMAGLSVWGFLAKRYCGDTVSPTRLVLPEMSHVVMTDDKGRLGLLFRLACFLAVGRPAFRSRAEMISLGGTAATLKEHRAGNLETAARLERDAEIAGHAGDPEAEECLRNAATIYKQSAANIARVATVERKRDVQGRACCMILSRACYAYFGKHLDKIVMIIANAALERSDIKEREVRFWRGGDTAVKKPKTPR